MEIRENLRKTVCGSLLAIGLFSVAAFAAAPKNAVVEPAWNPAAPINFYATVIGVREVAKGNPLAGLHLDAKANNKVYDIYLAPSDFIKKLDVEFPKGKEIHVIGSLVKSEDVDVVLVREVTLGKMILGPRGGFREELSLYMRNDDGPLWIDNVKPAQDVQSVH